MCFRVKAVHIDTQIITKLHAARKGGHLPPIDMLVELFIIVLVTRTGMDAWADQHGTRIGRTYCGFFSALRLGCMLEGEGYSTPSSHVAVILLIFGTKGHSE